MAAETELETESITGSGMAKTEADRRCVLSHFQARTLLEARNTGVTEVECSLDLNISTDMLSVSADGVVLPDESTLSWAVLTEVEKTPNSCFVAENGEVSKIRTFSEETQRYYSLMPTSGAPTMLISGIPMHRIKGTDPHKDTLEKIKAAKPIFGPVLDTATGLGYTAIAAAAKADHVTTVEFDPAALEVARLNPWSQRLFDNPKITQRLGDSYDVVPELDDGTFARIIHDPPMFNLAGHLYSEDFYADLYRVLRRNGKLFHYIGDPDSKSGANVTRGAIRRLQAVGFRKVQRRPRAFGLVAVK